MTLFTTLVSRVTIFLCLLLTIPSFAQVTITTGANWKDAMLVKSQYAPEAYTATTNYGSHSRLAAAAWTHSAQLISYRFLIRFDLGSIPQE